MSVERSSSVKGDATELGINHLAKTIAMIFPLSNTLPKTIDAGKKHAIIKTP